MTEETREREVLFRVGTREIIRNGLYAIMGPGRPSREMVVAYDPKTNEATWVAPKDRTFYSDGEGLMATILNVDLLEDAFSTPKPYLRFKGGAIRFDFGYKPTPEHWEILTRWNEDLAKAGIGGMALNITREEVREQFRKEYGFE